MFNPSLAGGEKQVIYRLAVLLVVLGSLAGPAMGQIVTPTLTPAPCSGSRCLNRNPGGRIIPQGATQAQRGCPQGTMFNARKGTCKVLQPVQGTP